MVKPGVIVIDAGIHPAESPPEIQMEDGTCTHTILYQIAVNSNLSMLHLSLFSGGIRRAGAMRMDGDVDPSVYSHASFYTPVPG